MLGKANNRPTKMVKSDKRTSHQLNVEQVAGKILNLSRFEKNKNH